MRCGCNVCKDPNHKGLKSGELELNPEDTVLNGQRKLKPNCILKFGA